MAAWRLGVAFVPPEHVTCLFGRFRGTTRVRLGIFFPQFRESVQRGLPRLIVAYQPAADDGAGATNAAPAVDVHRFSGVQVGVDGVQCRFGQLR